MMISMSIVAELWKNTQIHLMTANSSIFFWNQVHSSHSLGCILVFLEKIASSTMNVKKTVFFELMQVSPVRAALIFWTRLVSHYWVVAHMFWMIYVVNHGYELLRPVPHCKLCFSNRI